MRLPFAIASLAGTFLTAAVAVAAEPCVAGCLVEIQQPAAEYPRGATVQLAVRSKSSRQLSVYAVLDAQVDGVWRETPLTVSDPDHGFKAARLIPLKPGAELMLEYPACAALRVIPRGGGGRDVLIPCPMDTASPPHPVRLHVFVRDEGDGRQEVVSAPYRVLPE